MRHDRAGWVILGVAVLVAAAFFLREMGPSGLPWLPGCTFHWLTGWYCPGCGMTRAAHAVLNGEILQAFRFNPLGMLLLPLASAGLALEILGWVRGRPLGFRLSVGSKGGWVILWLILAFWLLRNLPTWPFTLLAPPASQMGLVSFISVNTRGPWPSSRTQEGQELQIAGVCE
jgi:Protein of unknown function (DUF2752)